MRNYSLVSIVCLSIVLYCTRSEAFDTSKPSAAEPGAVDTRRRQEQAAATGVTTFSYELEMSLSASSSYELLHKSSITRTSSIATVLEGSKRKSITAAQATALQIAIRQRGFIRLRAKASEGSSAFVESSIPACSLAASKGAIDVVLHLGDGSQIVGVDAFAVVPQSVSDACDPDIAVKDLSLNIQAHVPKQGEPVRYGFGGQDSLVAMRAASMGSVQPPPTPGAASAPAPQPVGPDGKPVPEEKSFLAKYWHFILPIVVAMLFTKPPEEEAKPAEDGRGKSEGNQGQEDGNKKPAAAQGSRPRG